MTDSREDIRQQQRESETDTAHGFLAEHVQVISVAMPTRRTVDIAGRCTMPTATAALCRRVADVQYLTADGRQVAAYCSQHDHASGPRVRMLRVQPWEYSERRIVAEYFPGTDVRRGPFGPRDSRKRSLAERI